MTACKQTANIAWVFPVVKMDDGYSLTESAVRLYNLITLCKHDKYELETIIDIVTLELDSVDLQLVRCVGKYELARKEEKGEN